MLPTRVLMQQRQPMIKFIGKRKPPTKLDHTPHPHPASPSHELPDSFASYRRNAQQHGPLGGQSPKSSSPSNSVSPSESPSLTEIPGRRTGASLGSVAPGKGEVLDRSELPTKFQRTPWTPEEIDAIDSGGASLFS